MAFTEDFSDFFDTDDFAVAATITIGEGSPGTVNGIFDDEYFDEVGVGSLGVEGSKPAFHCAAADVPSIAHGDSVVISGTTYHVVNVRPDGTGLVTLLLEDQT